MKKSKLIITFIAAMLFFKAWSSTPFDTTLTFNHVKHKLYLSVPSSYNALKEYPLVISLHWCPGSQVEGYGKDFRNAYAKFADSLQVIVACPDNFGSAISDGDIGILKATVDSVSKKYKINKNEVYLTGMSCNGYVTVRQGLKKVYPFKGVFAWDPWILSISPGEFDFNSTMPITLAIGTDDPNYSTILSLYDSLKVHHAKVNLVIVKNIGHIYAFPSFTDNMIRSFKYLNDTNSISISKVNDFEINDTVTFKNVTIALTNKTGKKMIYRAMSSKSDIISDPTIVELVNDSVKITIFPKRGEDDTVKIVFEASEKGGIGIEQITFNVKVNKVMVNAINSNSSQNKLCIYPNPAKNILNVNSTINLSKIEISDICGRRIFSVLNPGLSNQFDISNLLAGVYIVKGEGEKYSETKLFVIQ